MVLPVIDKRTNQQVVLRTHPLTKEVVQYYLPLLSSRKFEHPNIMKFLDHCIVKENLCVVMEYNGERLLVDILERWEDIKMTEEQIANVCLQVYLISCQ
jgi:hypothetical protein